MERPASSWKRPRRGTSFAGLGALEAEILAAVWERDPEPVSVRDIYEQLLKERKIAYTTVMTVMNNLTMKGLLCRDESMTVYRYQAAIPGDQVAGEVLESVVDLLYRGRPAAALSRLLGLEGNLAEEQLEPLRDCAQRLLARQN